MGLKRTRLPVPGFVSDGHDTFRAKSHASYNETMYVDVVFIDIVIIYFWLLDLFIRFVLKCV